MLKNSAIQALIQLCKVPQTPSELSSSLQALQNWRDQLNQNLEQILCTRSHALHPKSVLAKQLQTLKQFLLDHRQNWDSKWLEFAPAQSLADAFNHKVMLLVFGKFNAGKSSLCNLLADYFHIQGQHVQYFHLDQGEIIYADTPFKEGATETTVRLQGVCLGESLVLLDTPGLHSVTPENAELTQRFIDSADGVLWLSSSSSPGQVQELDALAQELRRHKPLLPIITRSDHVEEDEIDGEICTILCNKSTAQRTLQEHDVLQRSQEKLITMAVDPLLLKHPVSVSAQMARQANFSTQAISEAGFEHLFNALLDIIRPVLDYKQRKPAEMYLHYLQEHILQTLQEIEASTVKDIETQLAQMQAALERQQNKIIEHTWRNVVPQIPALLDQYPEKQSIQAIVETIQQWTIDALSEQMTLQFADYAIQIDPVLSLALEQALSHEILSATTPVQENLFEHEVLYKTLSAQLQLQLRDISDKIIEQCTEILAAETFEIEKLQQHILESAQELNSIAHDMRHTA